MIDLNIRRQRVSAKTVLVTDHTIPVTVKKLFTDVDGVLIDKGTLPAALQKKLPAFLFGGFDLHGGYKIALQSLPPDASWKYFQTFVMGAGASHISIIGWSGVSDIQGQLKTGDIIQVYTDSLVNPSYFAWVVCQNNYASIASIINNAETDQNDGRIGQIMIHEINYQADIEAQLSEGIQVLHYSNIGTWRANQIDPLGIYRSPMDVQIGLVKMPIKPLFLNQYIGLSVNMVYECDKFSMEFKIKTY